MPYGIRKQRCSNSDGQSGSYVVYRTDTGAKVSCHASSEAAHAAMRARYANESKDVDISDEDTKLILADAAIMKCGLGCIGKFQNDKYDRLVDNLFDNLGSNK